MRGYPWIRNLKAAGLGVLAMAFLAGLGMTTPLGACLAMVLVPLIGAAFWPVSGTATALIGAALPQICLAAHGLPAVMHLAAGGYGALTAGVSLAAFRGGRRFFGMLKYQWAAIALGLCFILAALRSVLGVDVFAGSARWLVAALAGLPNGNELLFQAMGDGLARAPEHMLITLTDPVSSQTALLPIMTPVLKNELMASLRTTLEMQLRGQVPGFMVGFVALTGIAVLCMPVCWLKRKGDACTLEMPAFEKWYLPQGMGAGSLVLLAGYGVQWMAVSYWPIYMGSMMISAFQWIYMIQGVAFWEFVQRRLGSNAVSRRIFVLLAGLFIPFLLVLLGIMDQRSDRRGLRRKQMKED